MRQKREKISHFATIPDGWQTADGLKALGLRPTPKQRAAGILKVKHKNGSQMAALYVIADAVPLEVEDGASGTP